MKLFVLFILFSTISVSAQNMEIRGQIIDQRTGDPLPDAYIVYQQKSRGVITDRNGFFNIPIHEDGIDGDTLYITHLGYTTLPVPCREAINMKTFALHAASYTLPDVEIRVPEQHLNWNKVFVQAVGEYAYRLRNDPFIAMGHYTEEASYQGKPILYMASLGYILYTGDLANAAPYSNMKFFCDQTRSYVTNPEWLKYRKNVPSLDTAGVVLPGSSSNLNFLRVQQEHGLLSPRKAKRYKCSLDSSFMVNQYPVYVLHIRRNKEEGDVQIMEIDDHYLIRSFKIHSQDYWSTAWHERLPAEVSVQFQYQEHTPFLKSITAVQQKDGLEYRNELISLIQKLDTFSVSSEEYWEVNDYSHNPYISFAPEVYNRYVPKGIRDQYDAEKKLFEASGIDLDEAVQAYTDRWFLNEPGEESVLSWLGALRLRIF